MHKPEAAKNGAAWNDTCARLFWAHDADRAADIVAGKDRATNADLARWRTLGRTVREP